MRTVFCESMQIKKNKHSQNGTEKGILMVGGKMKMLKYFFNFLLGGFACIQNSYSLNNLDTKPLYTFDASSIKKILAVKNAQEHIVAAHNEVWRFDSDTGKRLTPTEGFLKFNGKERFDIEDIVLNPTGSLLYISTRKSGVDQIHCVNTRSHEILYEKMINPYYWGCVPQIIAFHPTKSEVFISPTSHEIGSDIPRSHHPDTSGFFDQWSGKQLPFVKRKKDEISRIINCAQYSPKGFRFALTYSGERKIFIYDTITKNLVCTLERSKDRSDMLFVDKPDTCTSQIEFSSCGKYLISLGLDPNGLDFFRLWNIENRTLVHDLEMIEQARYSGDRLFSPDGKFFLVPRMPFALLVETQTSKVKKMFPLGKKNGDYYVDLSRDNSYVFHVCVTNGIQGFDISTARKIFEIPFVEAKKFISFTNGENNQLVILPKDSQDTQDFKVSIFNFAALIVAYYKKNNFLSLKQRCLFTVFEQLAAERAGKIIDKRYLNGYLDEDVDIKELFKDMPEYLIKAMISLYKIDKKICV